MSVPRSPGVLSPNVMHSPAYVTPEKYPLSPPRIDSAIYSPLPVTYVSTSVPRSPVASPPPAIHSPVPYVSPAKARLSLSPRDARIMSSAERVSALASATSEAAYKEELTGSRLAAARARANVHEITASNLQRESSLQAMHEEKQRSTANLAKRQVESAARQAEMARYKSLKAEKMMIDAESKRMLEEQRVARLEAETRANEVNVQLSHRNLCASEAAHHAARASVSQTRSSLQTTRRSISASADRKGRAESLLRDSYQVVNAASTDLARYSDELLMASEQEKASLARKEAALNVENIATSYLTHHLDPLSPHRLHDIEQASADIEAARLADHAATASMHEARLRTSLASEKLKSAESRLLGADAKARLSDAHFREAAVEVELGRQRLHEGRGQLEQARLLERESKLCSLRSKEQVVLNAQELARKRATLKRAKDRLEKSKELAGGKRKEADRQLASANVAEKVFTSRLEKERMARMEADDAHVRAQTAAAAFTETQVGLAYAKREEEDAAIQHHHACLETDYTRREMLNEVQLLHTLEGSPDLYHRYA
eukprot:TRINITY_DN26046_c0_g1_i1.p1 TRINITY_DN26046_c0_g1~~TRINITY_DN26046_c0_g1_i1.p1  ORF type:complete len:549 (+),score=152.36 TRINITY_DN26046_c0_g1_i1:59-1705(+)